MGWIFAPVNRNWFIELRVGPKSTPKPGDAAHFGISCTPGWVTCQLIISSPVAMSESGSLRRFKAFVYSSSGRLDGCLFTLNGIAEWWFLSIGGFFLFDVCSYLSYFFLPGSCHSFGLLRFWQLVPCNNVSKLLHIEIGKPANVGLQAGLSTWSYLL